MAIISDLPMPIPATDLIQREKIPLPDATDEPPPNEPPPDEPPPDNPDDPSNVACECAERVLEEAFNNIILPLLNQIAAVEATHAETTATILGSIDNLAGKIETAVNKAYDKIERQVNDNLGNAYAQAAGSGIQYPTDQQVAFGNQTGRFLESCSYYGTCNTDQPLPTVKPPDVSTDNGMVLDRPLATTSTSQSLPTLEDAIRQRQAELGFDPQTGLYPDQSPERLPAGELPEFLPMPREVLNGVPQQAPMPVAGAVGGLGAAIPSRYGEQPGGPEILPPPRVVPNVPKPPDVSGGGCPDPITDIIKKIFGDAKKQKNVKTSKPFEPTGTPDWNSLDACYQLNQYLDALGSTSDTVPENFGFGKIGSDEKIMPQWFKPIYDNLPGIIDDAVYELAKAVASVFFTQIGIAAKASNCNLIALAVPAAVSFIGGFLSRWISSEADRLTRAYQLTGNAICPQEIPSPSEADNALLTGRINEDTWRCWVKANNQRDKPREKVVESASTKLNVNEWLLLRMRNHINDVKWEQEAKNSGVILPGMREAFEKLVEAWPGIEDVIRFMVRDVDDERLVTQFGMDADFEHKWIGKTQDYGKGLGITAELAKRYWRAHWSIPSPTQLYEMFARNRKGRVADDAIVTEQQIIDALKQQDILPFWIPKLLAIAYLPLTRTDTQRAFFIDAIDRNEVKESYLDERYSPQNAEILTRFTEKLKLQYKLRQIGSPTPREATMLYARNEISLNTMRTLIREYGLNEESVRAAEITAGRIRTARVNKKRQAALKKRVMYGDIEIMDARSELINRGYEPEQAVMIIEEWQIEMEGKIKAIPAATLCRMRERNLMTAPEYMKALVRLGYTPAQANQMAADCGDTIEAHKMRKLMNELNKIQKANEARQKLAEKQAREAQRSLNRRIVSEERIQQKTAAKIEDAIAKREAVEALSTDPDIGSDVDSQVFPDE